MKSFGKRGLSVANPVRAIAVRPVVNWHALEIEFSVGERYTIDLLDHIRIFPVLKPLMNLSLFSQAKLSEWGFGVTLGDDLELSVITLYRLALEQSRECSRF